MGKSLRIWNREKTNDKSKDGKIKYTHMRSNAKGRLFLSPSLTFSIFFSFSLSLSPYGCTPFSVPANVLQSVAVVIVDGSCIYTTEG